MGLRMISRGGGDLSLEIMETRMKTLLRQQELRYRMVIEGVAALNQGLGSGATRAKLQAHYALDRDDGWFDKKSDLYAKG